MYKSKYLEEYCTGCGLCESMCNTKFKSEDNGFNKPIIEEKNKTFFLNVCPSSGVLWNKQSGTLWGDYQKLYVGWSCNEKIRKQASSGGVLTSVCIYLIENKIVDGIIQTKKSNEKPYMTETVISKTREDILNCMGSRYSISSPLRNIHNILENGKKYCFVGKPCDIYALEAYDKINNELSKSIIIKLSFFCAGIPSVTAQKKLLKKLSCDEENCMDLRYRGNGWPGYATATRSDGTQNSISYNDSWGEILGRDVRKSCRFCIDGVGTFSDISCGDAWHLKNGKVDFSESDGKNVIFARSKLGVEIMEDAKIKRYIYTEDYNINILPLTQQYQVERKATIKSMITAMKLCRKVVPCYPKSILNKYAKKICIKVRLKRFMGTIKRILQRKL